ncbi:MAG: IreB family regulatory phosphoprotein [Eubacteriales bacterium]|nr:IreB family regulatory phosphoprotein [Eubacteriales bacterium]NLF47880.1 IreB family regulatory phosphoprotein [Clostridiales bacterium]HUM56614.1 IreB family regulatory phosphoprotein [Bacillota bacterium]
MDKRGTIMFDSVGKKDQMTTRELLEQVYEALDEKGYNAIDQIVGYILSGDPSYITSHKNARNIIKQVDRDDLTEEIVKAFLGKEK